MPLIFGDQNRDNGYNTDKQQVTVQAPSNQSVQKTPYQQNVSQPVQTQSSWYKGAMPTTNEIYGRIRTIWQTDPTKAQQIATGFAQAQMDKSSPWYNPYLQATNQAVSNLQAYGIDTNMLTDDWFANNTGWQSRLRYSSTTNGVLQPLKKNSTDEDWIAYNLYQYQKSMGDTSKAESEWQALQQELAYKANNKSRNQSDDEIIDSIDWSKYSTLKRMKDSFGTPSAVELNKAIDFSDDAMRGVLWAARNNGGTGSMTVNMAMAGIGDGNVWKDDPELKAKLNWNNKETYDPYSVGATMDEDALMYFGVYGVDEQTLEHIRRTMDPNDETAKKMYGKISSAWETTQAAESELDKLYGKLNKFIADGKSEEFILKKLDSMLDGTDYKTLKAMDASIDNGSSLVKTTKAIPYKKANLVRQIKELFAEKEAKTSAADIASSGITTPGETPSDVRAARERDQKVRDASGIFDDDATPEESAVFSGYSGSQDAAKGTLSTVKDSVSNPEVTDAKAPAMSELYTKQTGAATKSYIEGTSKVYGIVNSYETKQDELAAAQETVKKLEGELGAKMYAGQTNSLSYTTEINGVQYNVTLAPDLSGVASIEQMVSDDYTVQIYDTGDDAAIWDEVRNSQEFTSFVDSYLIKEKKIEEANGLELTDEDKIKLEALHRAQIQIEDAEKYLYLNKGEYEKALADYNSEGERWAAHIQNMQDAGVDTYDIEVADAVMKGLTDFTDYEATVWDSYNPTYAYTEAINAGEDKDTVLKYAEAEYTEAVENIKDIEWLQQYIKDHNIQLPDNIKQNMERRLAKHKRDIQDYEFFKVQWYKDFDSVAKEAEAKEQAEIKAWQEAHPYNSNEVYANVETIYGDFPEWYAELTDDEKKTWYYLKAQDDKNGTNKAKEYANFLTDETYGVMPVRGRENIEEAAEQVTSSGAVGFIAGNALAIYLSPYTAVASAAYGIKSAVTGQEYNPNASGLAAMHFRSKTREQSAQEILETFGEKDADGNYKETTLSKIAQGGYEILTNRLDSAANAAAFGWMFGWIGDDTVVREVVKEFLSAAPMGISAASEAAAKAKEKGATDAQAALIGAVTFVAETGTEAISLDNMSKALKLGEEMSVDTFKDFAINWLTKAGISEAFGESLNDIIENAADEKILGELSEHAELVEKYRMENPGISEAEAEAMARRDEINGVLRTALISYLSPGLDIFQTAKGRLSGYKEKQTKWNKEHPDQKKTIRQIRNETREEAREAKAKDKKNKEEWAARSPEEMGEIDYDAIGPDVNAEANRQEQIEQEKQKETARLEQQKQEEAEAQAQLELKKKQAETAAVDFEILETGKGGDKSAQNAAVSAVLDEARTVESGDESDAAATMLHDVVGPDRNAAGEVQDLMIGANAANSNISQDTIKQGIRYAALGGEQSACRQVMQSDAYQKASPSEKATMLAQAVQTDQQNEALVPVMQKAVHDYRVAKTEARLLSEADTTAIDNAEADAIQKEGVTLEAQKKLDNQRAVEQAAFEAARQAGLYSDAKTHEAKLGIAKKQNEVRKSYEAGLEAAQRAEKAAKEKAEALKKQRKADIRQQAEQIVAQEDQQRALQAEQDRINAEKQAAEQQERQARQDEIDTANNADTDAFIEQNYPDATEEQKQHIRERAQAVNQQRQAEQEQTQPVEQQPAEQQPVQAGERPQLSTAEILNRKKIMEGLNRKFGIKIRVVDTTKGGQVNRQNGYYDEKTNTITIDSQTNANQMMYFVLAHELTHIAERAGQYYKSELANSLLRIFYGDEADYQGVLEGLKNGTATGRLAMDIITKKALYDNALAKMHQQDSSIDSTPLTYEEALQEIIADSMGEVLFKGNQDLIVKLATESPSAARRILDSIKSFLKRATGMSGEWRTNAEKTVAMLEKALKEAEKSNGKKPANNTEKRASAKPAANNVGNTAVNAQATKNVEETNQVAAPVDPKEVPEYTFRQAKQNRNRTDTRIAFAATPGEDVVNALKAIGFKSYDNLVWHSSEANITREQVEKALGQRNDDEQDTAAPVDDLKVPEYTLRQFTYKSNRGSTRVAFESAPGENVAHALRTLGFKSVDNQTWTRNGGLLDQATIREWIAEAGKGRRYSLGAISMDYQDAVDRGDMETAQRLVDERAKRAGYIKAGYHGTLNGGFTVFDKAYSKIGGNSGAGFYFSSNPNDSGANYSDVEGADNWFKVNDLADEILEEFSNRDSEDFEYEGYKITEDMSREEIVEIAKKILTKNPMTYNVYLNPGRAYVRDFNNSTNLLEGVAANFDYSQYNRNDYRSQDEYEDAIRDAMADDIYSAISNAVYRAFRDVRNNYEVYDSVDYDGIIGKITDIAMDYGNLTWNDLARVLSNEYIDIGTENMRAPVDGSGEIARAIIEAFGYDSIEDKEVSKKFNQLKNMGADGDTVHYIMFHPEQIKSADPVTYDNGRMISLDERFSDSKDIRYSLPAGETIATDDNGDSLAEEFFGGTVALNTGRQFSLNSFTKDEQDRVRAALLAMKGDDGKPAFTEEQVNQYMDNALGLAAMIAADRERLDFKANPAQKFLKPNNDYHFTLDASTLCAKRLLYQGTFDYVQHALPDEVFTPEDLIDLVNIMSEMGYETPCGICYVESRRRWLDTYANEFLNKIQENADSFIDSFVEKRFKKASAEEKAALRERLAGELPSIEDLTTSDGLEKLRTSDPLMHKAFIAAMNAKGSANPKVVQLRTEYNGDISKLTANDIQKVKDIGGLRIQSFSDFETPHLLDMVQAVMDMSSVGLTSQAYTKVANFAWVFGDTGIKINLSLIGKGTGLDADGNLVFDNVEGMNFDEAMRLRDRYSKNVGTILVGINDDHIIAAMADPRIDFIIPFHKSGWSDKELKGIPSLNNYKDYTDSQNERIIVGERKNKIKQVKNLGLKALDNWIKREGDDHPGYEVIEQENGKFTVSYKTGYQTESFQTHKERTGEDLGNFEPVGAHKYWEFDKSGEWNARKYLKMCADAGRIPKFSQFLVDNGNGTFSLPEGDDKRSTAIRKGYWKTLIDFKMYDNKGNGAEQTVVTPNINMNQAQRVLNEHKLGRQMPNRPDGREGIFIPMESNNDVPVAVPAAEAYIEKIRQKRMGNKPTGPNDSLKATPPVVKATKGKSAFHQTDNTMEGTPNSGTAAMASGAEAVLGNTETQQEEYTAPQQNAMAIDAETGDVLQPKRRFSLPSDAPYLAAVERGETDEAQRMVDEAAQQAGYTIRGYHGTSKQFTVFDKSKAGQNWNGDSRYGPGFYFAHDEHTALKWTDGLRVVNAWLKMGKPLDLRGETPEDIVNAIKENAKRKLEDYDPTFPLTRDQYAKNLERIANIEIANPGGFLSSFKYDKDGKMTDGIREFLSKLGYDGIITDDEMIVFSPDQIKSADPVTYDDNGNVIPLSERFNDQKGDIRYSLPSDNILDQQYRYYLNNGGILNTVHDRDQALIDSGVVTAKEMQSLNRMDKGTGYRQFNTQTAQASDVIDQRVLQWLNDHGHYQKTTNAKDLATALAWVKKNGTEDDPTGYNESLTKAVNHSFNQYSKEGQARMIALIGMAAATGDTRGQLLLMSEFGKEGTNLAQAFQFRKMFALMTPDGRQKLMDQVLDRARNDLARKGKNVKLEFSKWIYEAAAAADGDADMQMVLDAAYEELGQQIPATWQNRLRSLRMFSMLANPRTHIRNIIGNMLFVPAVSMKNKMGALMELGMAEGNRTKTLALRLPNDIKNFSREVAVANKDVLTGEAKYTEAVRIQKAQSKLGKAFDWMSDKNSNALEKEDWFFLKGHFRRAFGGWMVANGYTVDQVRGDRELMDKGLQYAVNEAQKATYRDFNEIASKLNGLSQNAKTRGGKALGLAVDAVLPFKKTPANILRRGVEYSPVGIAKGLYNLAFHMKAYQDYASGKLSVLPDNAVSPNEVIDQICSGLSGTAVMTLGFLLAGCGAVSCGMDDDDKLDKEKGVQEYSIDINKALGAIGIPRLFGEDVTYTMDWAAPMAMPFFVGAAIRNQLNEEGVVDIDDAINAIGSITEPVFNLSMLDGLSDVLRTSQYEETDEIVQIGAKVGMNYVTSYWPAFFGAVARTISESPRKAYVKKGEGKGLTGMFNYAVEQTENKIPGVNLNNIPLRNIWGEEKTSTLAERFIENFISPGYIEHVESDPVMSEIGMVFDKVGDVNIIPDDPAKDISYSLGGIKHEKILTDKEWDQVKMVRGQTAHKELAELMSNPDYQNADPSLKNKMIKDVWNHATKVAKAAVWPEFDAGEPVSVAAIAQDSKISSYKTEIVKALRADNYEAYDTMVEAMYEAYDDQSDADAAIREKLANTFRDEWKNAYRNNDYATMYQIEEWLDYTGYDFNIYGNNGWQEKVDEE